MPQVRGGRLERDRVAEPVGGRDGLLGGRRGQRVPELDAVAAQQRLQLAVGRASTSSPVAGEQLARPAPRAARTSSPDGDTVCPAGVARQAAYVGDGGQGAHRVLGGGVGRHRARPSPSAERSASGTPGMPRNVDTTVLRGLARTPRPSTSATSVSRVAQRRDEQRDHRVDAVVGEDLVERGREVVGVGVGAEGAGARDLEAGLLAGVDREHGERVGVAERRRPAGRPAAAGSRPARATSNIWWIESARMTPGAAEQRVDRGGRGAASRGPGGRRARRRGTGRTSPRRPASAGPAGGRSG